jgi:hypothetical protein
MSPTTIPPYRLLFKFLRFQLRADMISLQHRVHGASVASVLEKSGHGEHGDPRVQERQHGKTKIVADRNDSEGEQYGKHGGRHRGSLLEIRTAPIAIFCLTFAGATSSLIISGAIGEGKTGGELCPSIPQPPSSVSLGLRQTLNLASEPAARITIFKKKRF